MSFTDDPGRWTDWRSCGVPDGRWRLRTGRRVERNLYVEWDNGVSELVGQVDTTALARMIVDAVNARLTDQ